MIRSHPSCSSGTASPWPTTGANFVALKVSVQYAWRARIGGSEHGHGGGSTDDGMDSSLALQYESFHTASAGFSWIIKKNAGVRDGKSCSLLSLIN